MVTPTATPTGWRAKPEFRCARLTGPRPLLDPRRHVARRDLVEIDLAGQVAASRYVEATATRCIAARTPMRTSGDFGAAAVSELLYGEDFDVFETIADWSYGRSVADRYIGWVFAAALGDPGPAPTQSVTAAVAPLFAAADIKAAVLVELPFGARLVGHVDNKFLAVAGGGFVHGRHIAALPDDPLAIARRFAGAPYLWGGRTPIGVDCSGLVQAVLMATGIACPRDTDQQAGAIGRAVGFNDRAAGDVVFFPGHVGLLASRDRLFHANAHWMSTIEEPLGDVIARLHAGGLAQPVTAVRRVWGES